MIKIIRKDRYTSLKNLSGWLFSHTSVQWTIVLSKVLIKVKLRSFLLNGNRRLWLSLRLLMMLFLLMLLFTSFMIIFLIIFLIFIFFLLIILFSNSELFLNFFNQSSNLIFWNFVLFQNMWMLNIQLLSNFHRIRIENESL